MLTFVWVITAIIGFNVAVKAFEAATGWRQAEVSPTWKGAAFIGDIALLCWAIFVLARG